MISKHLQEVTSLLNRSNKVSISFDDGYSRNNLKLSLANYWPTSYEDVVLEFTDGKTIYAKDLEFAQVDKYNNILLGNYYISLN
jgi:hypothetical protein